MTMLYLNLCYMYFVCFDALPPLQSQQLFSHVGTVFPFGFWFNVSTNSYGHVEIVS